MRGVLLKEFASNAPMVADSIAIPPNQNHSQRPDFGRLTFLRLDLGRGLEWFSDAEPL
jgi:hypothetical protein